MAQDYDRTMKRLTSTFAADYVQLALGGAPALVEPLQITEQDKELPSLAREVDFAARVTRQGQEGILLLEFQTAWEADVPRRMADYTLRLHLRYGLPVYPVVAVLRPGGRLRCSWSMQAWGQQVARCRFRVLRVWQLEAEQVITQRQQGLYPLLPLMRWPNVGRRHVLERSQALILDQVAPREARADACVALRVLSGIVFPADWLRQVLTRREMMLESPVYEEFREEGREEGRERSRAYVLQVLA